MRLRFAVLLCLVLAPAAHADELKLPCRSAHECLRKATAATARDHLAIAASYLWAACAMGDAAGCALLGERFERGEGVPRADVAAARYFGAACDVDEGCRRPAAPARRDSVADAAPSRARR